MAMGTSWTPKVCKLMAFMAVILGLGLLFCILLGFRLGFFGRKVASSEQKLVWVLDSEFYTWGKG